MLKPLRQIAISPCFAFRSDCFNGCNSMGSQMGDDIRIAAGAMQFLSEHFKEVPLK